jgi:O-antigen/teichoic acid export membrane protein
MATPEFYAAHTVVPVLVMATALYGANQQLDIGLIINERTKYLMYNSVFAAASNLALNYLLIPRYGMMGAAVATLIAYLGNCLLNFFFSQRLYPIHYEWSRLLQLGVITGGLGLIAALLPLSPLGYSLLWMPIFAVAFGLALLMVGFFSPEEIAYAKYFYQYCRLGLRKILVTRKALVP